MDLDHVTVTSTSSKVNKVSLLKNRSSVSKSWTKWYVTIHRDIMELIKMVDQYISRD